MIVLYGVSPIISSNGRVTSSKNTNNSTTKKPPGDVEIETQGGTEAHGFGHPLDPEPTVTELQKKKTCSRILN